VFSILFHFGVLIEFLVYHLLYLTAEIAENAEKIIMESFCIRLNKQKRFSAKINAKHKRINPPEPRSNDFLQFSKIYFKP